MPWTFDPVRKQYISPSGRAMTRSASVQLRNNFAAARSEIARVMAEQLTSGAITQAEFAAQFQVFIEDTITASYLAGRGGVNAIVDDDLDAILKIIDKQMDFADEFVKELDGLSADEIANRASLYGDAAVNGYEVGQSDSHGVELPGYPGDWVSECRSGCRCFWVITSTMDGKTSYVWETASDSNVCETCAQRGRDWNPWVPS